jgi:radical SAM protein with 4Fe4S-binding SPASM domain
MSHTRKKPLLEKLKTTRSIKSFADHFLKGNMAGQKLFLYNERLPRVINISFNEQTCMFACKMCPYTEPQVREMYREGSEMSFETLKNIVESVPNDSYYSFDISAIGETLLFKPLPRFVRYMKEQRPLVNTIISTNGLLMNESLFRGLVESGLDSIQFSLFAENAEDHERITGSRSFQRVCENIRVASRVRKELGTRKPHLQTFMMETNETAGKVQEFLQYWSQYVDSVFTRPMYNVGREVEGMTGVHEPTPPIQRHPCVNPWYSTAIRSNGDVLACYVFHWHESTRYSGVIGNINHNTLEEIWQSPEFQRFRQAHRRLALADYPVCQQCDLWSAYTNVWKRGETGEFRYSRVKIIDFFTRSPEYRGA